MFSIQQMFVSNQFGSCEYNIGEQEYSMDCSGNLLIIQRKAKNQLNQYFYLKFFYVWENTYKNN